MKDDPLLRVHDCVLRFASERDDHIILDPKVLADARIAFRQIQRGERAAFHHPGLAASPLWILGTFHLLRYGTLTGEESLNALREGAICCLPLYERDPDLVPVPYRSTLKEWTGHGKGNVIDDLGDEAIRLLQKNVGQGNPEGIDTALKVAHSVLDATPAQDPRRARLLCQMAAALGELYRLRRNDADLDAAMKLLVEAEQTADASHRSQVAATRRFLLAERRRVQGNN